MPRPRPPLVPWIAVTAFALALPPALRAATLAATAATLFEATPFVLVAAFRPRARSIDFSVASSPRHVAKALSRAARLLGCGCGGLGVLSAPAFVLCWLAFGPGVALARVVVAVAIRLVAVRGSAGRGLRSARIAMPERGRSSNRALAGPWLARWRRSRSHEDSTPDPLAALERLARSAFAATLVAEMLRRAIATHGAASPLATTLLGIACGTLLGILAPCSTGAIAIAAAIRDVAPAASIAILATSGIIAPQAFPALLRFAKAPPWRLGRMWPSHTLERGLGSDSSGGCGPRYPRVATSSAIRGTRVAFGLLAVACGLLASHGPSGFVNPRFIVPIGAAAVAAAFLASRTALVTTARLPGAIPALLIGAFLVGSPTPERAPTATTLDDPYPGQTVRFLGALASPSDFAGRRPHEPHAVLVRYTITCCRADAEARAVRLDRAPTGPAGTWYDARGTLVLERGTYLLHVASIERVAPPADPFAYR